MTTTTPELECRPARVFAILNADGLDMTTDPDYPATAVYVHQTAGATRVTITGHNIRRQSELLTKVANRLAELGYTASIQVDGYSLTLLGYSDPQRQSLADAVVNAATQLAKVTGAQPASALAAIIRGIAGQTPSLTLRIQAELDRAKLARFNR